MPVYRCPIHQCWVDSDRDAGCPECLAEGGPQARRARKRNQAPPSTRRGGPAPTSKLRWLLYLFMLGLGASALALPQVQQLLRDQGLGEAADRAERVSSGMSEVATQVKGSARSAAEKLGVDDALGANGSEGKRAPSSPRTGEIVKLRTTHTDGGSALAYLPPRDADEARPLLVWLHGDDSNPQKSLDTLKPLAERFRFAILAPEAHAQDGSGGATWAVGKGGGLSDDEHHVRYCLEELTGDRRLKIDASHVLLAGSGAGAGAALHLASHTPRFTDAALLLGGRPSMGSLGEHRPTIYVGAGSKLKRAAEKLRGLGYDVRPVQTAAGKPTLLGEVEGLLPLWLSPKAGTPKAGK